MAIGSPSTQGLTRTKTYSKEVAGLGRSVGAGAGAGTKYPTGHPLNKPVAQPGGGALANPFTALLKQMGMGGMSGMGGNGGGRGQQSPLSPKQQRQGAGQNTGINGRGQGAGGGITVPGSTLNISTQTNPQMDALIGDYKNYRSGLAAGTDLEATQAMQRQRDAISGMAKEFGEGQAATGMYGSGAAQQALTKRVLQPGMDSLGKLNADMTSDARRQQLAALQGQGNAVGAQANTSLGQQQLGLDTWRAQQQAALQQAQLQQAQQNQGFSQLMALTGLINNMYSGF